MAKEMWIDRDECMLWFDVKPTYEALANYDNGATAIADVDHVAKVQVSDELYAAYEQHCKDVQLWQKILRDKFDAAMLKKKNAKL